MINPADLFLLPPPDDAKSLTPTQARGVVITHAVHRAFVAAAGIGITISTIISLIRSPAPPLGLTTSAIRAATTLSAVRIGAGRGGLIGAAVIGPLMLFQRLRGKSDFEWQDRAYRLLHHPTQVAYDWGSLYGAVAALGAGAARTAFGGRGGGALAVGLLGVGGVVDVVGLLGLGSVLGTVVTRGRQRMSAESK